MGKIVGAGSLIVDLTGYAKHLPVAGETVMGTSFKMGPGGKGSNQMTAAAKAGATVKMIGCWGKDGLAVALREHYEREKMSTEYIRTSETQETGAALIEVDELSGQNRIIVIAGANSEITAADVQAAEREFADCDVALCQFETSLESVRETIRLAKKHGKPVVLNPAPYVKVDDSIYDGVDYLTPNETEAEFITGVHVGTEEDIRTAARALLAKGVKKAIITLGERGSYLFDGKNELRLPCLKVRAVDTTGAGDAFSGGLAAALSDGLDDETAMKFAACTSSLSVTRPDSSASMPRREEIVAMMKSVYGIAL